MKRKITLSILLITAGYLQLQAQDFSGYRISNYAGVNAVFFNPASIADSHFKWDVNLLSLNGSIGNNNGDFKLKDLFNTNSNNFKNKFLKGSDNINATINADILGPSIMFHLTKKSVIALTSRVRAMGNIKDFDGDFINAIINPTISTTPYNIASTGNSRIVTNYWAEFGATYSREIINKGSNYLSVGATLKYLSGAGNSNVQINQFKTTINADAKGVFVGNTSGTTAIGISGSQLNDFSFVNFYRNGNNGMGGDVGIVYEYRPEHAMVAGPAVKDNNKYKFKISLSILDIGAIKYSMRENSSGAYNMHINGSDQFYLQQLKDKNIDQIKKILDANPAFFSHLPASDVTTFTAHLPTTLQGDIDYHFKKGFFVNVGGQINLVSKTNPYSAYQYNSVTITPHYEGKLFGIYIPVNYNELSHFNAGLTVRGGMFFIGSGSLITAMAKSKQVDLYVGFHCGLLKKKSKT